jgi:uncharacterized protein YxjI
MEYIILKCIKEKNKLRIKFHSFTDKNGKTFTNIYNQNYNCRFPKNIRQEGMYYRINSDDLVLADKNKGQPFYNINFNNIQLIDNYEININDINIFKVEECVICFENNPNQIFLPCAHQCICLDCYKQLVKKCCPLCRRDIIKIIQE